MPEKGPEKEIDLNALREGVKEGRINTNVNNLSVEPPKEVFEGVNTLEKFEALSPDDQILFMKAKDYDDLELFKNKHFGKDRVDPDINELREKIKKLGQEDK